VAILLTDSVNNAGETTDGGHPGWPRRRHQGLHHRRRTNFAPVPVDDPFTGRRCCAACRSRSTETLRGSPVTGGRYFRTTDGDALRRVCADIDRLEPSLLDGPLSRVPQHYGVTLAAGLLLACLACRRGTLFRRLP
jgi:hypothetical protein